VNAGQTVKGWLHFNVNSMRSYDLTLEIVVGVNGSLSEPPYSAKAYHKSTSSVAFDDGHIRRSGRYSLHEQSYHFDNYALPESTNLETLGLYSPENRESVTAELQTNVSQQSDAVML
jgi:hypothetical protein